MLNLSLPRLLCLLNVLGACAAGDQADEPPPDERAQTIVYGVDDRVEVYEHPDQRLRALARASVVALIPKDRVVRSAAGELSLSTFSLGDAYSLCADQRFIDQPIAADCSGVLIDRDLVATAGHCFEQVDCDQFLVAFDYFYRDADKLEPISASDLYACKRIVAREMSGTDDEESETVDYAVVQLDRVATGRTPVRVLGQVDVAQPVSVLGTGSGVPIKIDSGPKVLSPRQGYLDYFTLDSDTFEGSSGSPVVNDQQELVGILVRGGLDYKLDRRRSCQVVNRLDSAADERTAQGEIQHEEATYATRAVEGVCAAGYPSAALCQREASCGDGFCTGEENRASCARDCASCANGDCGAGSDTRALAGSAVEQKVGKPRASGCSLAAASPRALMPAAWLGLAVLAYLRRRRS